MASLVLASLLWALSFGLIKDNLAGLDPRAVAAVRLGLAALAFAPWLGRRGGERTPRGRLVLAGLGAVQFGLMYVLYIASYAYLPAYAVALFTVTTPIMVVLLQDLLSGRSGDGRTGRDLAAAAIAVVAGAWILWRALPPATAWPGVALLQGANLCFAAGQVGYRRLRRETGHGAESGAAADVGALAWMYLGAVALTAVVALVAGGFGGEGDPLAAGGRARMTLLYLGLAPTALGFWLWNRGCVRAPAGAVAVLNNLKIPLAMILAWALFGESADAARLLPGAAVLLGAAAWASRTVNID